MGLTRIDTTIKLNSRLTMSVWAREKVGKSHFILTAPQPIYLFAFDPGFEDIAHKFPNTEVYSASYQVSVLNTSIADREKLYEKFLSDFTDTIQTAKKGTLAIDTGDLLWQLIQAIYVEQIRLKRKSGEIFPFDYANANLHMKEILRKTDQNKNLNLILTHRAAPIYSGNGSPTGEYKSGGNKEVPYEVQVTLRIDKLEDRTRMVTIESCRQNSDIEGLSLPNADWDMVAALVGG